MKRGTESQHLSEPVFPDCSSRNESGSHRNLPRHRREGKEERKRAKGGVGAAGRECRQRSARASEHLSSISPGLAGMDGKLEGKVYSADCLVGQRTGGQVAMPIIAVHPSQV